MFFVWLNLSLSNPPILKPILLSFMRNKRKMEIGLFMMKDSLWKICFVLD